MSKWEQIRKLQEEIDDYEAEINHLSECKDQAQEELDKLLN